MTTWARTQSAMCASLGNGLGHVQSTRAAICYNKVFDTVLYMGGLHQVLTVVATSFAIWEHSHLDSQIEPY